MSPGKKVSHIVGLILSPSVLSASTKRFDNHHLNFHRQGTISLFSTPNCQSDTKWNPKTKLETKDLLAGSLHKIWLLNHRKKENLADCTPSVNTYKLQGVFQNFSLAWIAGLSNWKRFQSQFSKLRFLWSEGFLSNNGKHVRPIQRPFWWLHLLVDFLILLDMVSGTFCGQSAESIAYSDRRKSSIGLFYRD